MSLEFQWTRATQKMNPSNTKNEPEQHKEMNPSNTKHEPEQHKNGSTVDAFIQKCRQMRLYSGVFIDWEKCTAVWESWQICHQLGTKRDFYIGLSSVEWQKGLTTSHFERERERENYIIWYIYMHIYIYICNMYRERERHLLHPYACRHVSIVSIWIY